MTHQYSLFPDAECVPTIAMRRGETHVSQCAWCGLLVCSSTKVKLGPCPACQHPTWWPQRSDTGPFRPASDKAANNIPGKVTPAERGVWVAPPGWSAASANDHTDRTRL